MTLEEFAAKFRGPAKRAGHRLMVFCSSHEDERRQSLALSQGDDGKLLAHCYAGCQTEAILAAVGLRIADLFPDRFTNGNGHSPHTGGREIVATYDYVDGAGTPLYQVVRFAPKDFRQRRPDGQGGWIWNLEGVRRVLYRLPDLAEQTRCVWTEGEKDADRLATLGLPATTAAGGANAFRPEYAEHLAALGIRELLVLPDNDEPGRQYAAVVAEAARAQALTVRIIQLPGLATKGDVSDWFDAGHSVDELECLIAVAIAGTDDPTAPEATGGKVLRGAEIFAVQVAEPDWLLQGVISRAHQHMVVGASQGAKSWVLDGLGIAYAHPDVALFLGQPLRLHGRAAIGSWENGQYEDVRRIQKLVRGHGLPTSSEDLILISEPPAPLREEAYFLRLRRDLQDWGVTLYLIDSLSEAAGIELNDNTAYTEWWRARIKPLLDDGVTVVWTHLKGHAKPGVAQDRDSASRGATQIRALSTGVLDLRQLTDTLFTLKHNKHRDGLAMPFGVLELEGRIEDDFVRLIVRDEAVGQGGKDALARRLLTVLGQESAAASDYLTRKAIEARLNDKSRPKAERVSRKIFEAVLAEMVTDGLFRTSQQGHADVWTWTGPDLDETDAE
jgi:AAA domain-containing protein